MDRLAGIENHPLSSQYPCRTPVWWARFGDIGKDPQETGVSGRRVMLRIPEQFKRVEGWFARRLKAPREVRRPLDSMNSMVWELCDGSRTFEEVCAVLDRTFHEDIAPVIQRTTAALGLMQQNNLILILDAPLEQRWYIGPGRIPEHQSLAEVDPELNLDSSRLPGEAP